MYASLSQAEASLKIDYVSGNDIICDDSVNYDAFTTGTPQRSTIIDEPLSPVFHSSPAMHENTTTRATGDIVKEFVTCYKNMSSRLKEQLLNYFFKLAIMEHGSKFLNFVASDFLDKSLNAMLTLFEAGKHNLVYHLCECLQQQETSGSTRLPLDQMPYGLLDYNIRFFASSQTRQLDCEEHYASWTETMFAHFGHKWLCLHRGPVWQYVEEEEMAKSSKSLMEIALDESGIDLEFGMFNTDVMPVSETEVSIALGSEDSCSLSAQAAEVITKNKEESFKSSKSVEDEFCFTQDKPTVCVVNGVNDDGPPVPTLWTSLTEDDVFNIQNCLSNPQEMQKHHGIGPTLKTGAKQRNSGIFDHLKVSMAIMIVTKWNYPTDLYIKYYVN